MHNLTGRLFWRIPFTLRSPLALTAQGDLLRTSDGIPMLPGTAAAGAMRAASRERFGEALTDALFGKAEDGGQMSRLCFDDCLFPDAQIVQRGGILRDAAGVRTASACIPAVAAGAGSILHCEAAVYDGDLAGMEQIRRCMEELLALLNAGQIRFGARKTRGTGQVSIENAGFRAFSFPEDAQGYLQFLDTPAWEPLTLPEIIPDAIRLEMPLTLTGALHAPSPLIPGSMWNGACRGRAFAMLQTLCPALLPALEMAWGTDGERCITSAIVFDDSPLTGAVRKSAFRTRFSRLTDAASNVQPESVWYGGETHIRITIRQEYAWAAGLLVLVLRDLAAGLLAVGGGAAAGSGIFCGEIPDTPPFSAAAEALQEEVRYAQETA